MKKNTKNKFKKSLILLLPIGLSLLVIYILVWGINSYLNRSSYFNIKKVVLNGLDDKRLAQNISEEFLYDNIFSLDLTSIKENLKVSHPQFHDVFLIKNYPDQLAINVIARKPVAQIEQGGFFLVDNEGVIVSDKTNNPYEDNVIIYGLDNISELSFGKKINLEQLKAGIRLAQAIENINSELISLIPNLTRDKIKIDISKYSSLYVYCDSLELRFYADNLMKELKLFKQIIPSIDSKIEQVEYIDLRFAEPVVSFKK
ncbi:MAG: cell division protein FtsQ/DivIB [Candidatus Omnitrophota bacterium]